MLATDALLAGGGELAELSAGQHEILDAILPPAVEPQQPHRRAGRRRARNASPRPSRSSPNDPGNDGVLMILTPQDMTDPTQTAEAIKPLAKLDGKPLLASWMGGADVAAGQAILSQSGIPTFQFPDSAARAFTYMWRYAYNLRGLYETPSLRDGIGRSDVARPDASQSSAAPPGKDMLTESESKNLLAAYGIPIV